MAGTDAKTEMVEIVNTYPGGAGQRRKSMHGCGMRGAGKVCFWDRRDLFATALLADRQR